MIPRVIEARYAGDYVIWLRFDDGLEGEVDLKDELWGPVFSPLKNREYFAPEFLYGIVKVTA